MAGTTNLPLRIFRSIQFHSVDQNRSNQIKFYEFVVQKTRCRPRLVLGINSNNYHYEDNNWNDIKPSTQSNDPTKEMLGGSQFETMAALGRVECTSLGCKPVCPDDLSTAMLPHGWLPFEHAMKVLNARISSYNDTKMDLQGHFQKNFARYLNKVWMQKDFAEKYYELALELEPHNPQLLGEYAEFAWALMGNEEKAETLFNKALKEAPDDPTILGSYALFCWQKER